MVEAFKWQERILHAFQRIDQLFRIQVGVNYGAGNGAVAEGLLDGNEVIGFLI